MWYMLQVLAGPKKNNVVVLSQREAPGKEEVTVDVEMKLLLRKVGNFF